MYYKINCHRDGYYRGGIPHTVQPKFYPEDSLNKEQVQAMREDPRMNIVEMPDEDVPEEYRVDSGDVSGTDDEAGGGDGITSRDELMKMTIAQLEEKYEVTAPNKNALVDAVLEKLSNPTPDE
ncbi:hypothetical protein [Nitrospina gracilis]|uniref:hypothetical protein n=1 Tax=Nitrospina gracilis TaxID=35801 RepID=UPI001F42115F|nr:hypothetical protein [Nitrospina gracilis]MCF8719216.1 hypothetical protein [Nitrospina gracilis Nb-211]